MTVFIERSKRDHPIFMSSGLGEADAKTRLRGARGFQEKERRKGEGRERGKKLGLQEVPRTVWPGRWGFLTPSHPLELFVPPCWVTSGKSPQMGDLSKGPGGSALWT